MDLIIDIGNTRAKAAIFDGARLLRRAAFDLHDTAILEALLDDAPVTRAAVGSVADEAEDLARWLGERFAVIRLTAMSASPINSAYATGATLGADRLANAVAAARIFPGRTALAIDLGTCITYDLVNAQRVYLGGAIAPGARMRAQAMHAYGARLPLVETAFDAPAFGDSTTASLQAGIHHGVVGELEHFIAAARTLDPNTAVVLTGGDALTHARALKSGIFAHPFLTLEGFRLILHHGHGPDPAAAGPSAGAAG